MNQPERSSQAKQPSRELTEKEKAKFVDHYYTLYPGFKPIRGSAYNCDPAYGLCDSCKANWISREPELSRILSLGPSPKDPEFPAVQSVTKLPQTTSQCEWTKVEHQTELTRTWNIR